MYIIIDNKNNKYNTAFVRYLLMKLQGLYSKNANIDKLKVIEDYFNSNVCDIFDKESKPVRIGSSDPVLPKNFNIGLHFDVSDKKIGYNMNSYRSEIMNVKAILSVDADTLKVRFSISITEKRIFADGREVIVSL